MTMISACGRRALLAAVKDSGRTGRKLPKTLRAWSDVAINQALDRICIADANMKPVFLAIDTVAYAVRWLEFTGRFHSEMFDAPFHDTMPYLERMVSVTMRGARTVDFAATAYREFADLYEQHQKERAASLVG